MSTPTKKKYRTTNWTAYNAALKQRGSLLISVGQDMCWHGSASGNGGRSTKYSETAIQFCLTIKGLFNLALRQATGMAQSLLKLARLDWEVRISAPLATAKSILPWRFRRTQRRQGCTCWSTVPASRCWAKVNGKRRSMARTAFGSCARYIWV